MLCGKGRVGGEDVELRFVVCIVLHSDCEQFSIRFHFERAWNGKDKEKWGAVSARRV